MIRESKYKMVLIGIILALLASGLWFTFETVKLAHQKAAETSYYSGMSWLDAALSEGLDNYYKGHNRYPEKLSDLKIDFPGDNAKPEMLDAFKYFTDGKRYEMTWVVKYRDKIHIHKRQGIRGKSSLRETHINNRLVNINQQN